MSDSVALTEKPAHTPGPWTIGGMNGIGQTTVRASDGCRIAQVDEQFLGTGPFNARLIAAAPDMLAALKGILEDDAATTSLADQRARWEARMDAARAALAKAEGRA